MASICKWRNKHHEPNAILFFKIILGKTLEDGKLKIPNKFTKKYGGGLSNPVFLKPPDGTEWKVYWTKNDGQILVEKGWKEFATYYSLDHGHLMLFEYKETSHFEVHVFDMSGLEIDYPFNDLINDDSVEILKELPPRRGWPKKRLKSPVSSPPTSEQLRSAIKTRDVERCPNMPIIGEEVRRKQDYKSGISPCPAISRAFKEAKNFRSENPSFVIKIRQSILKRSNVNFSISFFRKYLNMNEHVMLRFGKKLWPAKLIHFPVKSTAIISGGWRLFVRESKLRVGDVCIFELINREDPMLDVHVYRGHR